MEQAIEIYEKPLPVSPAFGQIDQLQRWARIYEASSLLPSQWRKAGKEERIANLIIMLQRAAVLKCDPLVLLQNLDFIAGKMCWKSTFLLQLLLSSGWTSPQYHLTGDPTCSDFWGDEKNGMTFSAVRQSTGEREIGTKITVSMIKGEGWLSREGSKWKTMPEQMLKYRAVAFFCRSNAPDVMGGFYAEDEIADITPAKTAASPAQTVENKEQSKVVNLDKYNELIINKDNLKPGETFTQFYTRCFKSDDETRDGSAPWWESEQRRKILDLAAEFDGLIAKGEVTL